MAKRPPPIRLAHSLNMFSQTCTSRGRMNGDLSQDHGDANASPPHDKWVTRTYQRSRIVSPVAPYLSAQGAQIVPGKPNACPASLRLLRGRTFPGQETSRHRLSSTFHYALESQPCHSPPAHATRLASPSLWSASGSGRPPVPASWRARSVCGQEYKERCCPPRAVPVVFPRRFSAPPPFEWG